jgi:hypothetical protein
MPISHAARESFESVEPTANGFQLRPLSSAQLQFN